MKKKKEKARKKTTGDDAFSESGEEANYMLLVVLNQCSITERHHLLSFTWCVSESAFWWIMCSLKWKSLRFVSSVI